MKKYLCSILFLHCLLTANIISFAGKPDSASTSNSNSNSTAPPKIISEDITHSFFNNIMTNPAYTGIFNGHNIRLNAEIEKPFMTYRDLYRPQQYNAAYDVAFGKKKNNAIGVYYTNAKGGAFLNSSAGISFARVFNLTKPRTSYNKLRIGLSFDLNQMSLDYNKLTYGDMIDPRYGFIYYTQETKPSTTSKGYPNFNLGAWYYNPLFYFGLAAKNITQPNVGMFSVSVVPMEFNISTGGNITFNNKFAIHPSLYVNIVKGFKGKMNSYSPAIVGTFKQNYIFGLSYKDLNKITIHAGAILFDRITFSAAYGIPADPDLYGFGIPAYIGGDIRINFKNKPLKNY